MGTGTLALPFAAEKGGLFFNVPGLFFIGLWNYYSANCLLRCLEYIPQVDEAGGKSGATEQREYGSMNSCQLGSSHTSEEMKPMSYVCDRIEHSLPPPPSGTTHYGRVAWYAMGPSGLMALDLLMLFLFFGILIAYEVAMMSFIADTPLTTGSRRLDLLIPSAVIALLSCARDLSFLSKFSGLGLLAVALSFIVISFQGFEENGWSGFGETVVLWPKNLAAASSWFGVVVFGYGVVPFIFNIRDSMTYPQEVNMSLKIGLFMVYAAYIMISNGIQVLFSPSHVFDGDVLEVLDRNQVSSTVRLLMTFVVTMTAPLLVVPFGELVEGKLGMESMRDKILVRTLFCTVCTILSEFLGSGFVHIVSFIGCFCVSMTSFVLPPLFCIQLSEKRKSVIDKVTWTNLTLFLDVGALLLGITTTAFTSIVTFRELIARIVLGKLALD
jgi:amino acid permease